MSDHPKDEESKPTTRELVYEFIVQYKREHDGNSPTTREIAEGCNVSVGTVYHHLTRLELDCRISVTGERRRNIEIVGGNWDLADSKRAVDDQPGENNHDTTHNHDSQSRDSYRNH